MKNSRLFEYLKALSSEDWRLLKKHFDSNILKGSDLGILAKHVIKYHKGLNEQYFTTEYIHDRYFSEKPRKAVLNLYSELTKVLKDFLVLDQLKDDYYYRQVLLLQALNKRQLYKQADKLRDNVTTALDKEKISWWNELYKQLINHHYCFSDNPTSNKPTANQHLRSAKEAITLYRDQMHALYDFNTLHNIQLNNTTNETIREDFEFTSDTDDVIINLIQRITEVRVNHSEAVAENLKEFLFKNHPNIADDLRLIIYIVLRLFYARKANEGAVEYVHTLFSLQKFTIEYEYLNYNSQISPLRFIGVVELAALIRETEWGELFIEKYISAIPQSQRKVVRSISDSLVSFGNGLYKDSIEILSSIYPKDINLKSIMNRILLINYMELYTADQTFLRHRLDNYRLFINRNKKNLSSKAYKSSIHFGKIVSMIIKGQNVNKIRESLKKTELIFYRTYLVNKLHEMEMTQN